jgi:hypothetical protein
MKDHLIFIAKVIVAVVLAGYVSGFVAKLTAPKAA